jgi:hypothetical protein
MTYLLSLQSGIMKETFKLNNDLFTVASEWNHERNFQAK